MKQTLFAEKRLRKNAEEYYKLVKSVDSAKGIVMGGYYAGWHAREKDLREWLLLELQKPESERYNERSGLSHVLHMLDHPEKEEK